MKTLGSTKRSHLPYRWACVAAALALGLAACGGDDDAGSPSTALEGTAAVGAPIAGGAVQARCAGGSVLQTTTAPDGTWRIDTTGQTLPCGVRVSGGSLPAGLALHSVALNFATVNLTPLSDLITAHVLGQAPALWWGSAGPTAFSTVTQPAADQALAKLRAAFALPALQNVDPRTAAFKAVAKDSMDDVLEALQLALSNAGMDYSALLNAAMAEAFTLSDNFRLALSNAHAQITVGSGGGSGSGAGGSGSGSLAISVSVSGAPPTSITVANVGKPATQQEFCSAVADSSSGIGVQQAAQGSNGTLTINSCSFDGTVGRVSATVSITTPVAMSLPYDVVYTYQ